MGTCTFDLWTREAMNRSRDGRSELDSVAQASGGVCGGVG